MNQCIVIQLWK